MKITISERIQLHKLGYNREDIEAMLSDPEPETAPEPVTVGIKPETVSDPPVTNNNDAVLAALDSIKTQLQQMAIMNSNNPAVNNEQSTFDILNNIINNNKGGI